MSTDQNFEQGWRQVATEFHNKNDRATAILGAAFLEAHLGQLLESFFVENCNREASLLQPARPLGTFGARVDAAYCLGLISDMEYHDLRLIVQIQHRFANQVYGAAFTDDGIRDKCFQLRLPREMQTPGETRVPRQLFIFATAMLTQHLIWRTAQAEQNRRRTPEILMLIDVDEK